MPNARRLTIAGLLLLLLTAGGVALAPLGTGVPTTDDRAVDARAYVIPRMVALTETVETVRGMVDERSRNILALQANADRIERLTDDIDEWIAATDVPPGLDSAIREYEKGRDIVLGAIDDARAIFQTFDFSGMASLVEDFATGANHLQQSLESFQTTAP